MNDIEINTFIERMDKEGDIWEHEDVERVYGDVSLEEALQDRINELHWFTDILDKVINRRKYK